MCVYMCVCVYIYKEVMSVWQAEIIHEQGNIKFCIICIIMIMNVVFMCDVLERPHIKVQQEDPELKRKCVPEI